MQSVHFPATVDEWFEWMSADAPPPLSRTHRDPDSRELPWDQGCDPALQEDHPGSLTLDPPPVGRVEAGDDEVLARDRAAPAHRLWVHARGVFSICRSS